MELKPEQVCQCQAALWKTENIIGQGSAHHIALLVVFGLGYFFFFNWQVRFPLLTFRKLFLREQSNVIKIIL